MKPNWPLKGLTILPNARTDYGKTVSAVLKL